MRRTLSLTLALTLLSLPAFARNPPKSKPHDPKPPMWDTRGIEEVDTAPAVHNGVPFVPVPRLGMSGAMLATSIAPHAKTLKTSTFSIVQRPRFGVKTNNIPSSISAQYSADASNAADTENEPSLISINKAGVDYTILSYQQLPGLRAAVVPSIKWNTAAHNVMMAWHTRTAAEPTDETALYFLSFNPDTISTPLAIPAPFDNAAASQIQPALDNDDAGNVLVSYFTTQNNAANYQLYGMALTSAGAVLLGPTALDGGSYPNGFTGDYHETFYWTFVDALASRWNTSWARNLGGNWDIMATGVK